MESGGTFNIREVGESAKDKVYRIMNAEHLSMSSALKELEWLLDDLTRDKDAINHYTKISSIDYAKELVSRRLAYAEYAQDWEKVLNGEKDPVDIMKKRAIFTHNLLHSTERGYKPIPLEEEELDKNGKEGLFSKLFPSIGSGLSALFGSRTKKVT